MQRNCLVTSSAFAAPYPPSACPTRNRGRNPGPLPGGENWESAEALDAHLSTPRRQHVAAVMGDLLDDGGLTITRLRRIA